MSTENREMIYLLDDEAVFCEEMSDILSDTYSVITFQKAEDFLRELEQKLPDMVMIDLNLNEPEIDGLDVISRIKQRTDSHLLPILMISGADSSEILDRAFKSGIEDYIQKPVLPAYLKPKISHILYNSKRKLHLNALTGLPGIGLIEEQYYSRCRENKPFSVAYADLDNFKPFNDSFGVKRGDDAIQALAVILMNIRKNYNYEQLFTGHLGGDDFFLLGDDCSVGEAVDHLNNRFAETVSDFFTDDQLQQGYYMSYARDGTEQQFSLLSISTGILEIPAGFRKDIDYLSEQAAVIKKKAKAVDGNSVARLKLQLSE